MQCVECRVAVATYFTSPLNFGRTPKQGRCRECWERLAARGLRLSDPPKHRLGYRPSAIDADDLADELARTPEPPEQLSDNFARVLEHGYGE